MRLEQLADKLVASNPHVESEFMEGNQQAVNYLVDELMRKTHGEYHVTVVRQEIMKKLRKAR